MTGEDMPTESGAVIAMLAASGKAPDEFTVFMGALVEQQRRDYVHITSSLIDNLAMEVAETVAHIQLIGEAVQDLLSKPWAPSASAIADCLYPSHEARAHRTAEILTARGVHSSTHPEEGS